MQQRRSFRDAQFLAERKYLLWKWFVINSMVLETKTCQYYIYFKEHEFRFCCSHTLCERETLMWSSIYLKLLRKEYHCGQNFGLQSFRMQFFLSRSHWCHSCGQRISSVEKSSKFVWSFPVNNSEKQGSYML